MSDSLVSTAHIDTAPAEYLESIGQICKVWDDRTQDSGNISYGVDVNGQRYFVKTAGNAGYRYPKPGSTDLPERLMLLRNAVRLSQSCSHPALPNLYNVIETTAGPMLVYEWLEGDLLRAEAHRRNDPETAYRRFRNLPVQEIVAALDTIFSLHVGLSKAGWVAGDFYDGCLIYDFAKKQMRLIDLDHYHLGPLKNERGRMYGSTRFMAPEEFIFGEMIDERTTVFTIGRTAAVHLAEGSLERSSFRGNDGQYQTVVKACRTDPEARYQTVGEFYDAWCEST